MNRYLLAFFAVVEVLLTSGAVFGFSSLVVILVDQHVYEDVCKEGDEIPCTEQNAKLSLMFHIASSVFSGVCFPAGIFLDKFGPRLSCFVGNLIFAVGSVLFGISLSRWLPTSDYFIAGFTLMGAGGAMSMLSYFNTAALFPNAQSTIMSIIMGALDASSVCFFVFMLLSQYFEARHDILFLAYTGVPVLIMATAWKWPMAGNLSDDEKKERMRLTGAQYEHIAGDDVSDYMHPKEQAHSPAHHPIAGQSTLKSRLLSMTFKQQFASKEFILGLVFMSVHLLRINWYIGTINDQIYSINGINERSKLFIDIFGFLLPAGGALSAPLVGYLIEKKGVILSLYLVNIMGVLFGATSMIPNLEAQIATFAIFVVLRPFMFAVMSAFVAAYFGFINFGKLYGAGMSISAILSLTQYGGSLLVVNAFEGDYFWVNGILTVLCVFLFAFPVVMHLQERAQSDYVPISE